MDPNITTKTVNCDQETNLLMLNAIRNKFDAQAATKTLPFKQPTFNIPSLKIPENSNSNTFQANKTSSQLSQFLFQQLQEKCTSKTSTEFVLPQLKSPAKFEVPALKSQSHSANMDNLTTAITNLQVQKYACDEAIPKQPKTVSIDLTTALAVRLPTLQCTPPTRDFINSQQNKGKIDFEIPFIDCDRIDVSKKHTILLPASNEYCVTDVSTLVLHHSLAEPSVIGRFLCIDDNKYTAPLPLKLLSSKYYQQRARHKIEHFRFETKSPDDLVLLALNKYQTYRN